MKTEKRSTKVYFHNMLVHIRTARLEMKMRMPVVEETWLDTPLTEGVHTALGTSLLGRNSFVLNGCPGKKSVMAKVLLSFS